MLPNFLIIGAQKSGTTALYRFLGGHPQIYMSPVKEPNFLSFEGMVPDYRLPDGRASRINTKSITELAAYRELFAGVTSEIGIGEASPHYLYLPRAIAGIQQHLPEVRLIAILRDPVERAYSAYLHAVRDRLEPEVDFLTALRLEPERIRANCGFLFRYVDMGLYHRQLSRFYDAFDASRIRVHLYDPRPARQEAMVRDLFGFLGVDTAHAVDTSIRHNRSGIPGSRLLDLLTHDAFGVARRLARGLPQGLKIGIGGPLRRSNDRLRQRSLKRPEMSEPARRFLVDAFSDDIARLGKLIDRDLTGWLESAPLRSQS